MGDERPAERMAVPAIPRFAFLGFGLITVDERLTLTPQAVASSLMPAQRTRPCGPADHTPRCLQTSGVPTRPPRGHHQSAGVGRRRTPSASVRKHAGPDARLDRLEGVIELRKPKVRSARGAIGLHRRERRARTTEGSGGEFLSQDGSAPGSVVPAAVVVSLAVSVTVLAALSSLVGHLVAPFLRARP